MDAVNGFDFDRKTGLRFPTKILLEVRNVGKLELDTESRMSYDVFFFNFSWTNRSWLNFKYLPAH